MAMDLSAFSIDAMLCDSAVTAEGKLYVQGGGWDKLNTKSFPFIQSRIGLAIVLGVPYTETNRPHQLTIQLHGSDGPIALGPQARNPETGEIGRMTEVKAQFVLGRPPELQAGERQVIPIALNVDQLPFERPGSYSFLLLIDGEEINRLPFQVLGPTAVTINT